MGTTAKQGSAEARLSAAGRRIDELADRAKGAGAGAKATVGRRVHDLRAREAAARTKLREMAGSEVQAWDESFAELDWELDQIDTEITIAAAQLDLDAAEDRAAFEAAVGREIEAYTAYMEKLQVRAAQAKQSMRAKLEAVVKRVRERNATVAERLRTYREATAQASETLKAGIYQALDDLDRAVADARAKYE